MAEARQRRFWARSKRLTALVLFAWLLLSLLAPWFARDLNSIHFAGFPLGYWIAAHGALLAFLAMIVVYIVAMERLEAAYLADEQANDAPEPGPD